MKVSRYNIILERDQYSYWYNTLNKTFFRLSLGLGNKLQTIIKDIDRGEPLIPVDLYEKLKSGGFIIDNDTDEIETVRRLNLESIERKDYFLILLPTLNCNYNCWYCIQDHIESKMSVDVADRIRRHIDHMINVEHITSLHLEWFGGEPLMYFREIIDPISRYARDMCDRAGIPFLNSATTNGYFLDKEIARQCAELDFKYFQITLDGNREFHDKVKFHKGCESTFAHVLDNIDSLLTAVESVYVVLRINYTHRNMTEDIVEQVNRHIGHANRKRVRITPCKVWQENVERDFHTRLSKILDHFQESGYSVQRWNPITNFIPCYANKRYYNAVTYNGNVVKCTACNDMYEKDPKGVLCEDGTIEWRSDLGVRYVDPTYENERCLACPWLPLCMGLCPRDFINGSTHCKQDVLDTSFSDSVITLINHAYNEKQ